MAFIAHHCNFDYHDLQVVTVGAWMQQDQATQQMPPDWRHQRVRALLDDPDGPRPPGPDDDNLVRKHYRFLLKSRRAAGEPKRLQSVAAAYPAQYLAHQLFHGGDACKRSVASALEARLLARQTDEQIAAALGTTRGVPRFYAALYFDVRPHLHEENWILKRVLIPAFVACTRTAAVGPESEKAQAKATFRTRFLAYFGGPRMLDCPVCDLDWGKDSSTFRATGWERSYRNAVVRQMISATEQSHMDREGMSELLQLGGRVSIGSTHSSSNWTSYVQCVKEVMDNVQWRIGPDPKPPNELFAVPENIAAELHDFEIELMTLGIKPDGFDETVALSLPPPEARQKTDS